MHTSTRPEGLAAEPAVAADRRSSQSPPDLQVPAGSATSTPESASYDQDLARWEDEGGLVARS